VLIEVLRLNGLAAACGVLGQVRVSLVVVARVRQGLERIAGRTNALRACPGRRLLVLLALRPERPSARTLVQGSLRCLSGVWNSLDDSGAGWPDPHRKAIQSGDAPHWEVHRLAPKAARRCATPVSTQIAARSQRVLVPFLSGHPPDHWFPPYQSFDPFSAGVILPAELGGFLGSARALRGRIARSDSKRGAAVFVPIPSMTLPASWMMAAAPCSDYWTRYSTRSVPGDARLGRFHRQNSMSVQRKSRGQT
jgi:hypothetical protein